MPKLPAGGIDGAGSASEFLCEAILLAFSRTLVGDLHLVLVPPILRQHVAEQRSLFQRVIERHMPVR